MQSLIRKPAMGALAISGILFTASAFAQTQHYTQTNLVADQAGVAAVTDPNLVNPWGLARSSGGAWWISDNGPGLSTLYNGTGQIQHLVVTIPPADKNSPWGTPTGAIFNGTTEFNLAPGQPAFFLFVTEDGTVSGWNPAVNPNAVIRVNEKEKSVFKGGTIATATLSATGTASFLYVADFRKGAVRVFDANFHHVSQLEDAFRDDELPSGYAPFNVQNIGGNLYVSYGLQDSVKHDEIDGPGLGYVDVYSTTGTLLQRLQHGSWFNAPWGLVQASGDFGVFSHDILVGQFGSGEILAFNPLTGSLDGKLMNASNQPIQISGLWALSYGNDGAAGPATSLYFSAGSDGEAHGLFGTITAVENAQGNDQ